ncbi:MAG TPA: hypothetical protein VGR78_08900 [Verrucomicrobiae bacterium]|jgi:hypothetical protein|nr:hypothetical protein [Verrucomicrobiae bacterium]
MKTQDAAGSLIFTPVGTLATLAALIFMRFFWQGFGFQTFSLPPATPSRRSD